MYQNNNTRREKPLSLPEELEKLEQQITLTYQEIDRNFDRAHRIVTGSILPIVERYGKESKSLWENSEFWKTFFEASAGVKFNVVEEEQPAEETTMEQTTGMETTDYTHTSIMDETSNAEMTGMTDEGVEQPQRVQVRGGEDTTIMADDSMLDSIDITGAQSTPKKETRGGSAQPWAKMDSPFNRLKREMDNKDDSSSNLLPAPTTAIKLDSTEDSILPLSSPLSIRSKPPNSARTRRTANRPSSPDSDIFSLDSSPFQVPPTTSLPLDPPKSAKPSQPTKNWRIQATPLAKTPSRFPTKRGASAATPRRLFTDTLNTTTDTTLSSPHETNTAHLFPTTPSRRTPRSTKKPPVKLPAGIYDSDSDEESFLGMSPPVTLAFSLPQRKLLATPAREASRRIVNDILETAGAKDEESTMTTPIMMSARKRKVQEESFEDEDDVFG